MSYFRLKYLHLGATLDSLCMSSNSDAIIKQIGTDWWWSFSVPVGRVTLTRRERRDNQGREDGQKKRSLRCGQTPLDIYDYAAAFFVGLVAFGALFPALCLIANSCFTLAAMAPVLPL